MITAIRKRLEGRDEGFTLIELLVVVIIIGILAAIAIPTFLRQRENGYNAAAQSALRNSAIAQESFATSGAAGAAGTYATTLAQLQTQGYNPSPNVTYSFVTQTNGTTWCATAVHTAGGQTWAMGSQSGQPVRGGTCTATGTVTGGTT